MKISWIASVGIGIATAAVALVVGGWLANRAVTWYQIPSREGGSGYFVVFQALFAAVAGLVVGIVVSRYAGNFMDVTVMRALASAQVVMLLLLATIGGIARLFADVPPEIGGQKLLLSVELSWPEAGAPVLEAADSPAHIMLGSTAGRGASYPSAGPLWTDHTRHDGGRVIVPGAIEVYTSRGKRILQVMNGDSATAAFQVPLDRYPPKQALEWSSWIPVAAGSAGSDAAALQYRYRVVKRNEPVRVDTVGPFTIEMMVNKFSFYQFKEEQRRLDADATFNVLHKGQPIKRQARPLATTGTSGGTAPNASPVTFNEINSIAVVGGDTPALLAELDGRYGAGGFGLIREQNGKAIVEYAGAAIFRVFTHRLSLSATGGVETVTTFKALDGAFDKVALATPALYVFPESVLDTRTLTIHAIPRESYDNDLKYLAPVSLSPDATKLARLGGDAGRPVLREIVMATGATRDVPLSTTPVSDGNWTSANREWFDYYFEWKGAPPEEMRIVQRANIAAIVRRGLLMQEPGYRQYDLSPVDSGMQQVVEQFLIDEFHATRKPSSPNDFSPTLMVDGQVVHVYFSENKVGVFMDRNTNTLLVATIARKFDEALATRKYDSHFLAGQR